LPNLLCPGTKKGAQLFYCGLRRGIPRRPQAKNPGGTIPPLIGQIANSRATPAQSIRLAF
jgi:hypothetical protein